MKLNDKTTVKTLREMIGKKIRTRTSRETIEIIGIELTNHETLFFGYEDGRKRRVPIERVHELIEVVEDVKKSLVGFKSPIRKAEEKRLKKIQPKNFEELPYLGDVDVER